MSIDTVKIKKPGRNTYHCRPKTTFTGRIGDLIPVVRQILLPGDRVEVKSDCIVKFPPLTAPAFARMNVVTESFFVPMSQISDNFEDFIQNIKKEATTIVSDGQKMSQNIVHDGYLPLSDLWKNYFNILQVDRTINDLSPYNFNKYRTSSQQRAVARLLNAMGVPKPFAMCAWNDNGDQSAVGLDARWLGYVKKLFGDLTPKSIDSSSSNEIFFIEKGISATLATRLENKLLYLNYFRAYQHIWNEYYRDPKLHDKVDLYKGTVTVARDSHPHFTRMVNSLLQIRPRCYKKDLFNTAVTDPTLGAQAIAVPSNVLDLRKANIIQRVLEKRAMCGSRFADFLLQHFGVAGDNYELDRPLFLGRSVSPVHISETLQTSSDTADSKQGNRSGNANAYSNNKGIYFKAPDYGIFMTLVSVVPDISYIGGLPRELNIKDWESFPLPEFSNIGLQPIRSSEISLASTHNVNDDSVFGYEERYAEYKYIQDRVFGDFEDSLNVWHQYPNMMQYYSTVNATIEEQFPVVGFRSPYNFGVSSYSSNFVNRLFNVTSDDYADPCLFSFVMDWTKNTTLSANTISV